MASGPHAATATAQWLCPWSTPARSPVFEMLWTSLLPCAAAPVGSEANDEVQYCLSSGAEGGGGFLALVA